MGCADMTKIVRKAVMRPRECRTCGSDFLSRSSKKIYCDACRHEREKAAGRAAALAKIRAKGAREVGSSVPCQHCGAAFVLKSGAMKFCAPCASGRFNRWHREARKRDRRRNISERMSRAINASLQSGKGGRGWQRLVDYSLDDLMAHLERQFSTGMTWENRRLWHVDHITPLASFTFSGPDDADFKAAWSLSNLRPLWARHNQRKSGTRTHLL